MLYPLRLIVSFACSYLFPRLNPHSLIGFRCTSTVLLVQKKKADGLIILRHCYKASNLDLDMDLCHTDAFDSWPYQSN